MDIILERRSVRKFDLSKKIEYATLVELCRYGESAPSARRQESREYIIVDEQDIIYELSSVSKGSMILSECNTLIAVIGRNPDMLTTPRMQAQDLSAATQNILLSATQMGYGSCWIGIYPIEERMQEAARILGLTEGTFVFSLIALGYPKEATAFFDAKKFKEEYLHHNRY